MFTYTSHIIVTFGLAGFIFLAVTLIGLVKHGVGFLKFFVPSGVPYALLPILIPIEVISYFVRPIFKFETICQYDGRSYYAKSFCILYSIVRVYRWLGSLIISNSTNWI